VVTALQVITLKCLLPTRTDSKRTFKNLWHFVIEPHPTGFHATFSLALVNKQGKEV
jgi:hypothetical protein